jgi:xylulokinase
MDYLLGIDFGTGGCKVSAMDAQGNIVASVSEEFPTSHPQPGWAEQDPAHWHRALLCCLGRLREGGLALHDIAALALDGSTHNAVLLDHSMRPLRPTIMWNDQRSVAEAVWLETHHGEEIFRIGFQRPTPTWTLPQMLWLRRNEPDVCGRIAHVLFLKDYVRYLLTGVVCTDYIEAQGSLFFDVAERRWSPELCALAGFGPEVFPKIVSPVDFVGWITRATAAETGLREGTPVICGSSDTAAEAFAAGAVFDGQAVVKLATAGNFNVMTGHSAPTKKTLTYSHVVPGLWYSATSTSSAAICMRWVRDHFCEGEKRDALSTGTNAYALMGQLASESPPGARGVFFHPYLQGERSPYWDASLRGSFTGLALRHGRGDLIRAVMEGVAFSLRDCRRVLDEIPLPVGEVRLIGGGAKDPLWAQIVCDVLNVPLRVPLHTDASAGAAMLAGVGVGIFSDERAAAVACARVVSELSPDAERAAFYTERFSVYQRLHDVLADVSFF